jgi:hypothetical protein
MKPQKREGQHRSLECALHSLIFLDAEKHIHKVATQYAEQAGVDNLHTRKQRKRIRDERINQLRELFFATLATEEESLTEISATLTLEPDVVEHTVQHIKEIARAVGERVSRLSSLKMASTNVRIGRRLHKLSLEQREKLLALVGYSNFTDVARSVGIAATLSAAQTALHPTDIAIATSIAAAHPTLGPQAAIGATIVNLCFVSLNTLQNWRLMGKVDLGTTDSILFTGSYILAKKTFPNSKFAQSICTGGAEIGFELTQSIPYLAGALLSHNRYITTLAAARNGVEIVVNCARISLKEGLLRNILSKEQILQRLPLKKAL